jgi:ribosomal protein L34
MDNPRKSKVKKKRKSGFRARMRTKGGRKILANRRKGFQTKK